MNKFYTENFGDIKRRPNSERKSRSERRAERRARRAKRRAERRAERRTSSESIGTKKYGCRLIPGVKNRYLLIAILIAVIAYYMMSMKPKNDFNVKL